MSYEGPGLFDALEDLPRRALARKLAELAAQNIYFGGSSWKYIGWLGQIYTRERYMTRGRFSRKKFEQECLAEYAETFPAVCGDFSFYQFPPPEMLRHLFSSSGPNLQMAFKVPELITVRTWPSHARYGSRSGTDNETYLNVELLKSAFLTPLEEHANRVAALIFEFGAFPRSAYERPEQFLEDLDHFLAQLPAEFRYGVEIRNPEFLVPAYQECLRRHNVAHTFNSWWKMPPLEVQIADPGNFTADFTVIRALLRPGRNFQTAVDTFAPYDRIQDPYPEGRRALWSLAVRGRAKDQTVFAFVNNRFEGNSPDTIQAVAEDL